MPLAAVCSGGSPSLRSACQRASEPCGSASMARQRRPAAWAQAARWAVSVLLPAPPLRDANVMTFMEPLPSVWSSRQPAAGMVNGGLSVGAGADAARKPLAEQPVDGSVWDVVAARGTAVFREPCPLPPIAPDHQPGAPPGAGAGPR